MTANAPQAPATTFRPHAWMTAPATSYDEAAVALAPELAPEDNNDWLECGDKVRIERTVCRSDAAPEYGHIRRVNADVQYALIELETSGFFEWFALEEVFLVVKRAALEDASASAR